MRSLFHPSLPNGPTGDPALWVDLLDEGTSVLLDAGDLRAIPNRKLLRVERVVVTHTHMDHFIGFDQLLRLALGRDKELAITGPAGFLDQVRGKIEGYTWNLIDSYPVRLVAEEVDGDTIRSVAFSGAGRMRPELLPDRPFNGTIHAHRAYTIRVAALDHGVPVLGVALDETEHLSVNKDRLSKLGLVPGGWLRELKLNVRRGRSGDESIEAATADGGPRTMTCGELADEILKVTPGQRIGYLTDIAYTDSNIEQAVDLVSGADLLVCEAAFLHEDLALARERAHLTARQCGELARQAAVKRLAPVHFSPRYAGREREILEEVAAAFGGPVEMI